MSPSLKVQIAGIKTHIAICRQFYTLKKAIFWTSLDHIHLEQMEIEAATGSSNNCHFPNTTGSWKKNASSSI